MKTSDTTKSSPKTTLIFTERRRGVQYVRNVKGVVEVCEFSPTTRTVIPVQQKESRDGTSK